MPGVMASQLLAYRRPPRPSASSPLTWAPPPPWTCRSMNPGRSARSPRLIDWLLVRCHTVPTAEIVAPRIVTQPGESTSYGVTRAC